MYNAMYMYMYMWFNGHENNGKVSLVMLLVAFNRVLKLEKCGLQGDWTEMCETKICICDLPDGVPQGFPFDDGKKLFLNHFELFEASKIGIPKFGQ